MKMSLFFMLALSYAAMGQSLSMEGMWNAHWERTLQQLSQEKKVQYDSLDSGLKDRIRTSIESLTYAFAQDHSCTISWQGINGHKSSSGTWSWDPDDYVLAIYVNGSVRNYRITVVDQHTISMNRGSNTGQFVEDVILIKN